MRPEPTRLSRAIIFGFKTTSTAVLALAYGGFVLVFAFDWVGGPFGFLFAFGFIAFPLATWLRYLDS